ncbi:hypothetical protein AUC68_04660 [Methyloceanibacter methanicus]|uniref:Uncharacterized protein n=1 Tax=Methyloceanibacter methanicus TaxID=1774968 RepID=A0A1E3W0I6_9HYPH|nr:hypothetical protein AUC68_04660 [Methyloceanibacter methanicus]
MLFHRKWVGEFSLRRLFIIMAIKVVQRQRQETLRRFLQRAIEHFVDLMPNGHGGDPDADEPESADQDNESAD